MASSKTPGTPPVDSGRPVPPSASGTALLGSIATLSTLIVGIAYLQGWLVLRAYFDGIGAPWYLASLGQSRIVGEGAKSLLPLALAALLTFDRLHAGFGRKFFLPVGAAVVMLGSGIALFADEDIGYAIASLGIGTTMGEGFWRLSADGFRWSTTTSALFVLAFSTFVITLPLAIGAKSARHDFDPKVSTLPFVLSSSGASRPSVKGADWRLVDLNGDAALLSTVGVPRDARQFAVAKIDAGWSFGPRAASSPPTLPATPAASPQASAHASGP